MNSREAFRNYLKTGARIGESMEKTFKAGFLSGLASQKDHIGDSNKLVNKVVFDSESARQFLIESVLPKFSDSTFQKYVLEELAGDFAYQLAMYLASQPQQPNAWQQAIDDELVNAHLGIAKDEITREEAKAELNKLIAWHIDIAKYFESQAQQESQWISVEEELPTYGQIVDLSINGVLQNETYEIDATDNDLYLTHFWTRDGLDDGLDIEQGQFWRARLPMPKPLPPAPEGSKT